MKVVVYTANIGGKDYIREPKIKIPRGVNFIYFTDQYFSSKVWQVEEPRVNLENNRRTARWHKINSHLLFPDADYTIWVDANCDIDTQIVKLLGQLKGNDIACIPHPQRDCAYDEADVVKRLNLDNKEKVNTQMENYKALGFPEHFGLYETQLLVRKNTEKIKDFNKLWWSEIAKFSQRDQLSVMFSLWWLNIEHSYIPRSFRIYNKHKIQTTRES